MTYECHLPWWCCHNPPLLRAKFSPFVGTHGLEWHVLTVVLLLLLLSFWQWLVSYPVSLITKSCNILMQIENDVVVNTTHWVIQFVNILIVHYACGNSSRYLFEIIIFLTNQRLQRLKSNKTIHYWFSLYIFICLKEIVYISLLWLAHVSRMVQLYWLIH